MKKSLSLLLLLCLPLFAQAWGRSPRKDEVRAIWVTRFDYKSPADVSSIIVNCQRAGFTDIFFQVRGNGTAFYPSQVEPWAFELFGKDVAATGKDPGWDPLLMASGWAKKCNVRLHAYINVLPGWRGRKAPPRAAGQAWTAHPEWFMVDSTGTKMQPTGGWYSFLNPAHPDVRKHLIKIASELSRYDIAGLHLDYIRFPYDYKDVAKEVYHNATAQQIKAHSTFSYDTTTLAAVNRLYGKKLNQQKWNEFRRNSVTTVVSDLNKAFKKKRPKCVISSSVLADMSIGYNTAFQDSKLWAEKNLVDWLVPMNYSASLYNSRLQKMINTLGRKRTGQKLVVGINCAGDLAEIRRQIDVARTAGCRGFALFAYSHLFKGHKPTEKASVLR